MSLYNQGYSFGETSKLLENAFNKKIPRNTIHYWSRKYTSIFTYLEIRDNDKRTLPLMPRVYPRRTFSMHRNKVDALPDNMSTLVNYLRKVHQGMDNDMFQDPPFSLMRIERIEKFMNRREFTNDSPEIRIAGLAEENEETDPIRSILINDRITLCRNLPIYKYKKGQGNFTDFIDIIQYDNGRINVLSYQRNKRPEEIMKHLIISGRSLVQRTHLDPSLITLGAFDTGKKWTLPLPILVKRTHKPPKDNR